MRIYRAAIAAALAFTMTATPVLAQTATPLSIARSGAVTEDESRLDSSGYLLPAIVIIAVLAAAILLVNNNDKDNPSSP